MCSSTKKKKKKKKKEKKKKEKKKIVLKIRNLRTKNNMGVEIWLDCSSQETTQNTLNSSTSLSKVLGNSLLAWLPKKNIIDNMLKIFATKKYTKTSCIIDCSEGFVEYQNTEMSKLLHHQIKKT